MAGHCLPLTTLIFFLHYFFFSRIPVPDRRHPASPPLLSRFVCHLGHYSSVVHGDVYPHRSACRNHGTCGGDLPLHYRLLPIPRPARGSLKPIMEGTACVCTVPDITIVC
ncbi:hypothetical protein VTI28DRAFT_9589 [Corynascus sepedonium]